MRHIEIESPNHCLQIYNATLTLFVVVPVASVLTDPDSIAIAVTAGIFFETTMSLLILFAPKMYLTLNEGVILSTLKKQAGMCTANQIAFVGLFLTFCFRKTTK